MGKEKESFTLNWQIAKKAVEIVEPAIKIAMKRGILKRKALAICVLDPKKECVLYESHIGDKTEWKYPFDKIARSKAEIARREKKDTSYIKQRMPWMFEEGDTVYSGGVYFQGLVVGVSGVQQEFDEMIAKWIIHTIKAFCSMEEAKQEESMEKNGKAFLSKK